MFRTHTYERTDRALDVKVLNEVILKDNTTVQLNGGYFDPFSRLRVSSATSLFDAQLTYDLQPLLFEQVVTTNTQIVHNTTNRAAVLSLIAAVDGNQAFMQTYEHFRYQPGKGGLVFKTFNFGAVVEDVIKFAGYSDGTNGIEFIEDEGVLAMRILSSTEEGNEIVTQANWNLDKLDGTGKSGITLDTTKVQILVLDFQALYVGRVRTGFDLDGEIVYVHEFNHANRDTYAYLASANLPLRVGIRAKGAVAAASIQYYCASVNSEGGQEENFSYPFSARANVTAADGVSTLGLAIQPSLTFNGFTNRTKLILDSFEITLTGNNPVDWELVVGQGITTPALTAVNSAYSAVSTVTGALSGSPAIIIQSGSLTATAQSKGSIVKPTTIKLPLTLDAAGAMRDLARVAIIVRGVTSAVPVRIALNWKEIR